MNELSDLLRRIVGALDRAAIAHMIAGSFASSFYGAVRMTQDINIIIDPSLATLMQFIRSLPEQGYYVDLDAARDALVRRAMFNVMDMETGWKIDFIIRKARPFSIVELERRKPARLFDVDTFVASPEDVILAKLEWSSMSGSERQLADVVGMIGAKHTELDVEYLEKWAAELNVLDSWHACR